MARREELSDEQWAVIELLLGEMPRRADERARPWLDNLAVINGILWILRTGAPLADLPEWFPPYQTCHRRFQLWVKDGTLRRILEALAEDLQSRGKFDLSECFIDGTFVSAKKGALGLERPSGAKVRSPWQWQMALVFLSPFTRAMLRRMKSDLLTPRSNIDRFLKSLRN
jgi:transposase